MAVTATTSYAGRKGFMSCNWIQQPAQRSTGHRLYPRLRVVFATALLGLTPLSAANFPNERPESDELLAFQAKTVLAADPLLRAINLTVSVVDGVVLVGGAVPDEMIPRRIEDILRSLPGMKAVKVNCWVVANSDPYGRHVQLELDRSSAGLPTVLYPPLALPTTPNSGFNYSKLMAWPTTPDSSANPAEIVTQRPLQPTHAGLLLDPIATNGWKGKPPGVGKQLPSTVATAASPYPTIPPQEVPLSPMSEPQSDRQLDADTITKIGQIRASDPRFGWLTIHLHGEDAVISGRAWKPQDAWDYAEALRKLPGIGRIVIGNVKQR